jgi:phosphoglycerate dehydrogenase-like enzyme
MKVLVYHRRWAEYCPELAAHCPGAAVVGGYSAEVLREHRDAEAAMAWQIPLDWLQEAPHLRWLQLTTAGADHLLDVAGALGHVVVTNARGIHGDLMADFAMAAIGMLQWDAPRLLRDQQARRWESRSTVPLAGRTLGVIGLGAIGGEIARRGAAAGMHVLGVRRTPTPMHGVDEVFPATALRAVLPRCDFVVVVVPRTRMTEHLIGGAELAAMASRSFLINIARGGVVDETALVDALRRRQIAGAVLDVFDREPLPADSAFWDLDNVIVTPHMAGEPADYVRLVTEIFAENYRRWCSGQPLRNIVDLRRGY